MYDITISIIMGIFVVDIKVAGDEIWGGDKRVPKFANKLESYH